MIKTSIKYTENSYKDEVVKILKSTINKDVKENLIKYKKAKKRRIFPTQQIKKKKKC